LNYNRTVSHRNEFVIKNLSAKYVVTDAGRTHKHHSQRFAARALGGMRNDRTGNRCRKPKPASAPMAVSDVGYLEKI
jgi:hypothetical protein